MKSKKYGKMTKKSLNRVLFNILMKEKYLMLGNVYIKDVREVEKS